MDEKRADVPGDDTEKDFAASKGELSDLDETYELYRQQDARDVDPGEARRVLWKIDLHILPLLVLTYLLQYLDKITLNFASVFGLREGTNLQGQQYSWVSSIFYFGKSPVVPLRGDSVLSRTSVVPRLPDRSISRGMGFTTLPNREIHRHHFNRWVPRIRP